MSITEMLSNAIEVGNRDTVLRERQNRSLGLWVTVRLIARGRRKVSLDKIKAENFDELLHKFGENTLFTL